MEMTYADFELREPPIIIANEESFREQACGTCLNKEVCEQWEFQTGQTLYSNVNSQTKEPLKSKDGTSGVYRCSRYDPDD